MKKNLIGFSFIFLVLFLSGCTGPDGQAYQKYWWTGLPGYFYDTNPSTPSKIYNDTYFSTNPGSYYMEYESWSGSPWYMYYTITTKKGSSFNTAGDNTWFEIWLLSEGPSLYKWDYARSIDNNVDAKDLPSAASITRVNEKISSGKNCLKY